MLTCEQVTARATAFLEGELTVRQWLSVRLHLAMCVHCRRFCRQMRQLVVRLHRQEQDHPVSERFVDEVVEAIEREQSDVGDSSGAGT